MKRVFRKPFIYWMLGIFFVYLTINIIVSQFYITVQYVPYYLDQLNWFELVGSFVLAVAIASLISVNSVFGFIKYQERKAFAKGSTAATCAGTVAGLSTGVCAACVSGVFPTVLGVLGVSFSWAALPLGGVEVQLATAAVLATSLYFLNRRKA